MILGAHLSTTGGLERALEGGKEIGADAVQVFTRNQVRWKAPPISREEAERFRATQSETKISSVLSHGSYLVNLASPSPKILKNSRDAFRAEIARCRALGIPYLVFHPGAHLGAGLEAGLKTLVESLKQAIDAEDGVMLLLEVTAGQGSYLGSRFEELKVVLDEVGHPARLGVCLDTCHLFAAGYDIATGKGYDETFRAFESLVGVSRLKAFHLNDAHKGLGSHLDRHAGIGEGSLGLDVFRRILRDPRFQGLPMVLETPGEMETWRREIALLRKLAA